MTCPGIIKEAVLGIQTAKSLLEGLSKSPIADKYVAEVLERKARAAFKPGLLKDLAANKITKADYKKTMSGIRRQNIDAWPGNLVRDISHPIDNFKKHTLETFFDVTPKVPGVLDGPSQLTFKKPLGMTKSLAWNVGLPTAFAVPPLLEKDQPLPARLARATAMTAPFMFFRRIVPAMGVSIAMDAGINKLSPYKTSITKPRSIT